MNCKSHRKKSIGAFSVSVSELKLQLLLFTLPTELYFLQKWSPGMVNTVAPRARSYLIFIRWPNYRYSISALMLLLPHARSAEPRKSYVPSGLVHFTAVCE